MTQQHLIDFVLGLSGVVPEQTRYLIASRLARLIGSLLKTEDERKNWYSHGASQFVRACEIAGENRWVPDDLRVEATELAKFCDRWMEVSSYRAKGGEDEWKPISPEQNSLRVTMIDELKKLGMKEKA